MKKIMFSDKYGLTQAVLNRSKTMTRRVESGMESLEKGNFCFLKGKKEIELYGEKGKIVETIKPRYKVGEVVAIAQNYKDAGLTLNDSIGFIYYGDNMYSPLLAGETSGWTNKMFVQSDLMPNQIRITNIKVERLQDISDEDCLKEGILKREIRPFKTIEIKYQVPKTTIYKDTPREAFTALIDKVSGKGTWDSNPWVFVYEFKLI